MRSAAIAPGSSRSWRWVIRITRQPSTASRRSRARSASNAARLVGPPPVGLHDEPGGRPAEVELTPAAVGVDLWARQAGVEAQLQHPGLELAARERHAVLGEVRQKRAQRG